MTTNLFTPLTLGELELPNRCVMAPLTRNRAGDGNAPTEMNVTYYQQRASAGLIITEANWNSTASSQMRSMSASVASGFSNV